MAERVDGTGRFFELFGGGVARASSPLPIRHDTV
jgi:hypothetical protein